jgi:ABC-2 type transport system permease protein
VPNLMLEEKQNKTLDALMVSPASPAQVVLGKALAGLFYVLLSGGLFFALNWAYVTQWGLALLAFLCITIFSIGLALVLGSVVKTQQQMSLIAYPIFVVFMMSAFFAQEPLLAQGLKNVLAWVPSTALVDILRLSFATHAPAGMLMKDLAISLGSIVLIFGLLIWQVRRSDQ